MDLDIVVRPVIDEQSHLAGNNNSCHESCGQIPGKEQIPENQNNRYINNIENHILGSRKHRSRAVPARGRLSRALHTASIPQI